MYFNSRIYLKEKMSAFLGVSMELPTLELERTKWHYILCSGHSGVLTRDIRMSLVNTPEGVSRLNYLTSAGVCFRMTPIFLCSTKSINHLVHPALVYLDICCVRMVLHCNDLLMLNRIPFLSFLHCSKVPCCKPQWAILQKREVQWTP